MLKQLSKLMKKIWKINLICIILVFLVSCGGPLRLNEFDLADSYQKNGLRYEMNLSFESLNDTISNLEVQINTNDLLFAKTESSKYLASYSISCKVFEGYNNELPIDTTTVHYSLKQNKSSPQILHKIKIYAPKGKNYVVKVSLLDENRNFLLSKLQTHRKKSKNQRSYYRIQTLNSDIINFTDYQKDSFKVTPQMHHSNVLKVMKFSYKTTCAAKPQDVTHVYRFAGIPDSTWIIKGDYDYDFPAIKNGYYHFITDTITNDGFSIFSINASFPKINSIDQANGALGYLLDKSEYSDLLRNKNKRNSFENEWIRLAGSRERARNLIKDYYSEVAIANKLFTSNQIGWSTDRGMIYIIYGPPKIVYRYNNTEIWIYGEENNLLSERFEFTKIKSDIADNIYELKRSINFKVSYNRMVNAWIDERGY